MGIDRGLKPGISSTHLGINDKAALSKTSDHKNIILVQDDDDSEMKYDDTFKTKMTVELEPAATTTWIGAYGNRQENMLTDGTTMSIIKTDNRDTAYNYSWTLTIPANGSQSVSSKY